MRSMILGFSCLLLSSCETFERLGDAVTTPDPTTGKTPVQTVTEEVPELLVNPFALDSWVKIGAALTGVGIAVYGGNKVHKYYKNKP